MKSDNYINASTETEWITGLRCRLLFFPMKSRKTWIWPYWLTLEYVVDYDENDFFGTWEHYSWQLLRNIHGRMTTYELILLLRILSCDSTSIHRDLTDGSHELHLPSLINSCSFSIVIMLLMPGVTKYHSIACMSESRACELFAMIHF